VLGPTDHGRSCELALHQRLRLNLPEAPTSGFRWQGAEALGDDAAVRCLSSDFAPPPAVDAVGGQGMRGWVFEARAAGSATLQMCLRRPGGGQVADRFALTIQVAA
jgi:predicted secreted protein